MITKNIDACLFCRSLIIGRQMENNYRQFIFDCSGFPVEVTSIMLVHQRSRDVAPYIAATSSTNTLTWTVTDTDTAYAGFGCAELRISFANGLAKSIVYQTNVIASITGDTVIPEPLQSWYDALIEYIDEHAASPEQIAEAVADYIETHPIDAPVQSVNGKTGTVVLTASDVGALADSVTIPTRVSQLTNDAGYITSAPVQSVNNNTGVVVLSASDVEALPDTTTAADIGGYVKPSAGIPKTDLTATVQASLDKADTALQTAPVTSVDGKTGAVQILPNGGSAGQVLAKASATDRDVEWITPSGGGGGSDWQVLHDSTTTEDALLQIAVTNISVSEFMVYIISKPSTNVQVYISPNNPGGNHYDVGYGRFSIGTSTTTGNPKYAWAHIHHQVGTLLPVDKSSDELQYGGTSNPPRSMAVESTRTIAFTDKYTSISVATYQTVISGTRVIVLGK